MAAAAAAAADPEMRSQATGAIDDLDQLLRTVNKVDETQLRDCRHTRRLLITRAIRLPVVSIVLLQRCIVQVLNEDMYQSDSQTDRPVKDLRSQISYTYFQSDGI